MTNLLTVLQMKQTRINHISFITSILFFASIFNSCVMETPETEQTFKRPSVRIDLPEVLEKGKLTVLMENSSTSYFFYKGKDMGFEYEILKLFADEIGVELEVKIVKNLDSLIPMLNRGDGDIISCNYTVTKERNQQISFSEPLLQTHQVLVQRKPTGWEEMDEKEWMKKMINDPSQLAQKEVHVWQNSSYHERLLHLQEEIGDTIHIEGTSGNLAGEELIEMVSEGFIDYTITEANVAKVNERFLENIYTDLALSVNQKIAFGLRKSSHLLKVKLDQWLIKFKNTPIFRYINKKYFEMPIRPSRQSDKFALLNGSGISKFDAYFKKSAASINWDWRLLASIAYQESKFNPDIQSFGGAYGLMQFMPNTGPHYGVYPDSPPDVQISGGAKKIKADEMYWKSIPDEVQRKKFAIASYNTGRGHVIDAQRLAQKHGLNPNIWDNNVETMLLNLSKKEYYQDEVVKHGMLRSKITYHYVREVFARYLEWAAIYD